MKSAKVIVIVIIVLVLLGGGGYLLMHKKSTTPSGSSTTTSSGSTKATNAPSVNNSVILTKTSASLGKYLTDPSGKPLYTYGADTSGVSNCSGACLATWPAYQATSSSASLPTGITTITRSDGKLQYAYNSMPLYYFVSDHGSTPTGDGIASFSLARPAASTSTQTPAASSSSTSSSSGSYSNPY